MLLGAVDSLCVDACREVILATSVTNKSILGSELSKEAKLIGRIRVSYHNGTKTRVGKHTILPASCMGYT